MSRRRGLTAASLALAISAVVLPVNGAPTPVASAKSGPRVAEKSPPKADKPPPAEAKKTKPPAAGDPPAAHESAGPKPPKPPTKPASAASPITRTVAGAPASADHLAGPESPELRALRDADLDLFGAAPAIGSIWPSDLPSAPKGPLAISGAGGLPLTIVAPPAPTTAIGGRDLSWLAGLEMPDLPVRWDARVIKYLEFFRDDPRGRRILQIWFKRSGRYRELIQETLRARGMPEDLAWVALVESGFDPVIRSPAGAAGLWQFMPETARLYGLGLDRWADGRSSPVRATAAAAGFLADLKKRFGTWELALAAYNMGYGGALGAVKRFNTNDFWELSRYENGLPWETTLYVPKIIAIAVIARNPSVFAIDAITPEPSLKGEAVDVPAGTELRAIAALAGCNAKDLEALNPELRAGRTPPGTDGEALYTVLVPTGRAAVVRDGAAKLSPKGAALERYVVRFGETLDQIAAARRTTKAKLVELNVIAKDEAVRGGTVLLVPAMAASAGSAAMAGSGPWAAPVDGGKPIALVPGIAFAYPDRKRVFYRVVTGDTPREIAEAFGVTVDEVRTWNSIDPTARLQEGMTLQLFVPRAADLARVVHLPEGEVRILAVGSDDFYDHEEAQKGRKRTTVLAAAGDTLESIGKKHGLTAASMERINRRPRTDPLKPGEAVIVYVPAGKSIEKPAAEPKPDAKPADEEPRPEPKDDVELSKAP